MDQSGQGQCEGDLWRPGLTVVSLPNCHGGSSGFGTVMTFALYVDDAPTLSTDEVDATDPVVVSEVDLKSASGKVCQHPLQCPIGNESV